MLAITLAGALAGFRRHHAGWWIGHRVRSDARPGIRNDPACRDPGVRTKLAVEAPEDRCDISNRTMYRHDDGDDERKTGHDRRRGRGHWRVHLLTDNLNRRWSRV